MIVFLVLLGRHGLDGRADNHMTSKRIVSIDFDKTDERKDVQKFRDPDDNTYYWGLRCDTGWWKVIYAYEFIEPTVELHEDRYPVSYGLDEQQFYDIVKRNDTDGRLFYRDRVMELRRKLVEIQGRLDARVAAAPDPDAVGAALSDAEDASGYAGQISAILDKDAVDGEAFTAEQRETIGYAEVFVETHFKE